VFTKKEPAGDVIVGLFNTGARARTITVAPAKLGLPSGKRYALANLWKHTAATSASISATVPSHGVALYRVTAR
jgi:Alpha galactosidase C-terminal beta sandwich domain